MCYLNAVAEIQFHVDPRFAITFEWELDDSILFERAGMGRPLAIQIGRLYCFLAHLAH